MSCHNWDDLREQSLTLASAVGPSTAWLAQRLWSQAAQRASGDCLELLALARRYSPIRIEAAVTRMIWHNAQDLASLYLVLACDLDQVAHHPDADLDGQLCLPLNTSGRCSP